MNIGKASYWLDMTKRAVQLWLEAQAFIHAAALAFFTVFSIAPIVIIAVSVVGLVLGEDAAQGQLAQQLEAVIGAKAAAAVQTAVAASHVSRTGILPTLAGIGAMVFGATTVFAQLQVSLNSIWGVAPRPSRNTIFSYVKTRVLSLTVVLAIGFVMLVSLLLSVAVRAVIVFAQDWLPIPAFLLLALDAGISLLVVTLLFAAIFRLLPDVELDWRDVWLGAFVTALLFSIGRGLIAYYLSTTATASTYGAAGSLVLLLMWVNYSSLILLFGAAFTRANVQMRGIAVRPRKTAVNVRHILESDPVIAESGATEQTR